MKFYEVEVKVWLKKSVFDPQGNAVEHALTGLGYEGVDKVRIGKYMQLLVEATDEAAAHEKVKSICDKVLHNPVMETYSYTLIEAAAEVSV